MGMVRRVSRASSTMSVGWRTTRLWRAKLSSPEMIFLQRLAWSTISLRSSAMAR